MAEPSDDQESNLDVSTEIDATLDGDLRKIGDVWRALNDGLDISEITERMSWAAPGPAYSYRTYINVLRGTASPPTKPTMAFQCSRQIASFVRRHPDLSNKARELLEQRRQQCESNADEYDEPATPPTGSEATTGTAGVYVYTLPHYIHHPVRAKPDASSTPRTFLKVGKSDVDIEIRIKQQSSTAIPEPSIKLRMYRRASDHDHGALEAEIHSMLDAADHNPNREKGAGREWFLTNLKFLDVIAGVLGAQIQRYNEDQTTELET